MGSRGASSVSVSRGSATVSNPSAERISRIGIGDVIEDHWGNHLVTRKDNAFVYTKEVKFGLASGPEIAQFIRKDLENNSTKFVRDTAAKITEITNMDTIKKRYKELA